MTDFPTKQKCKQIANNSKCSWHSCDSLIDMCEADGLLLEVVADADEVKVAGDEDKSLLHISLFVQGQHLKTI